MGFFSFIIRITCLPVTSLLREQKALWCCWAKQSTKRVADFEVWGPFPCPPNCDPYPCHGGECLSSLKCSHPQQAGKSCAITSHMDSWSDLQDNPLWLTHGLLPSQHLFCAQVHGQTKASWGGSEQRMDIKMQPWHGEEPWLTWGPPGSPLASNKQD